MSAGPPGAGAGFEVWRQDDNGQRFLVSVHGDRDGAEAKVAELEGGVQHKQTYYIRARDGRAG